VGGRFAFSATAPIVGREPSAGFASRLKFFQSSSPWLLLPSALLLIASSLAGLGLLGWRRRQNAPAAQKTLQVAVLTFARWTSASVVFFTALDPTTVKPLHALSVSALIVELTRGALPRPRDGIKGATGYKNS
jgi:hypothetical protein